MTKEEEKISNWESIMDSLFKAYLDRFDDPGILNFNPTFMCLDCAELIEEWKLPVELSLEFFLLVLPISPATKLAQA